MFKVMLEKCRGYLSNEAGLAAVMLAMLLPALVASAGIAVDLSTAYNSKNRLSEALDKAVLAVGSSTASGLTTQQLQDRFTAFFNANYPTGKYGTPYDVSLAIDGSVMTGSASAHVPTTFMSIAGVSTVDISATSQAVLTLAGVEAVLVLDVTGSMAGNNIAALKTASTNFLNIMFTSITDPKYIKIGIVPWNETVNVGSYGWGQYPDGSYYGKPFVSPPATDNYMAPGNITYDPTQTYQWWGCVVEPNAASITQDNYTTNWTMYRYPSGSCTQKNCTQYSCNQYNCAAYKCNTFNCTAYACAQYNCATYSCEKCPSGYKVSGTSCKKNCGSGTTACTTPGTSANGAACFAYGNTCIQQGACQTYGNTCLSYSNQCQTYGNTCLQQGACQTYGNTCVAWADTPNENCAASPVVPLTNNETTLKNEINGLPTLGNTYSDIGMVWGWRVVSPNYPFQEASAYSDTNWSKTVILMTDGNNTINTVISGEGNYGATGTSTSTTEQNNKFEQVCTNMKAMGIRIYTITFQSAINATTQQFYRSCATNPSMYYNAPANQDLVNAFEKIATQLSQLHLSK